MFDPVLLFEDIASSNGLKFIYGAKSFLNWEITQQVLTAGDLFLAMFPFEERGKTDNGSVSSWNVSTILWVGLKFDPSVTLSNLDETEKQKYDRRLKVLSAMIQKVLDDLCASDVELVGEPRRFRELNKFDENTDVVGCDLSFIYDINQSNGAPFIPSINSGSDITDTSFIANWDKINATGYYIDVAVDASFITKIVNNIYVGNKDYKLISGLVTNTDYWYRIRACNSVGTSLSSTAKKVTTL
jgi:hypothetical protein